MAKEKGNMGVAYHNDPEIRWAGPGGPTGPGYYPKRRIAWTGDGRGWTGTTMCLGARGEPRVDGGWGGHPLGVEPGLLMPGRPCAMMA